MTISEKADIVEYLKRATLPGCDCTSCKQQAEWVAEIEHLRSLTLHDGDFKQLVDQKASLVLEVALLRKALRPFASAAKMFKPYPLEHDDCTIDFPFLLRDLREAEAALATESKPQLIAEDGGQS